MASAADLPASPSAAAEAGPAFDQAAVTYIPGETAPSTAPPPSPPLAPPPAEPVAAAPREAEAATIPPAEPARPATTHTA